MDPNALVLLPMVCIAAGLWAPRWIIAVLMGGIASALMMGYLSPGSTLYEAIGAGVAGALVALLSYGIRRGAIWIWRSATGRRKTDAL